MAAPATPSNYLLQQGNAQNYLSWDLTPTATSYKVQRSIDGVNFVAYAAPVNPEYLDTAVTVGTTYWYKVAATNTDGDSAYTADQSIVPTVSGDMTLGQVRLLAQQRSDQVNSNFLSTTEWNRNINNSYFELYDLLVNTFEDYSFATPFYFQTTGAQQYALPNGIITDALTNQVARPFQKMLGVDLGLSSNTSAWVTIKKFEFISRNRYVYPQLNTTYLGVFNLRYRVVGDQIMFIPAPAGGQFVRVWYVPRMVQLLKDRDILYGISGWAEYVVIDAAIKAMGKEESDASLLMAEKAAIKKRIEESAANRDAGIPDTISDIRSRAEAWGGGFGPGGDGSFGGY